MTAYMNEIHANKNGGMPRGAYSSSGSSSNGIPEKIPSGYRKFNVNNFTPEQHEIFKNAKSYLDPGSFLSKLASGDQSLFDEMEATDLQQFNQLQGGIASRFSGQGMGARNSSGFQNTSNAASQDFSSKLQSRRFDLRNQAIKDLMDMSNQLMGQKPYEQGLAQKRQKQGSGWGNIIGTGLGAAGGFFMGGPEGALTGAQIGNSIGSAF